LKNRREVLSDSNSPSIYTTKVRREELVFFSFANQEEKNRWCSVVLRNQALTSPLLLLINYEDEK